MSNQSEEYKYIANSKILVISLNIVYNGDFLCYKYGLDNVIHGLRVKKLFIVTELYELYEQNKQH